MKFYNPLGFIILAVIPIIIILHFFKNKNQNYDVSSLYLWRKAVSDSKDSRTSKKLNELIRLIIQLLAALAAALACARPYIPTEASKYTIIADCSMSMENKEGEMKKKISDFVSGLDKNSEIVVIGANENPEIAVQGTDKKRIIDEINKLKTGIKSIDYMKTDNIAENVGGECWFFSDLNDENIPEDWNTVKIGRDEDNIAVTYLNCGSESAAARVSNFSSKPVNTKLSLYIDDKMYECREISLEADKSEDFVFDNVRTGSIIKCVVNDDEGIFSDNTMYAERLYKRVQLCCDNVFIEKAVSAVENIGIEKSDTPKDGCDIYIFDGAVPEKLPDGNIIIFNIPKENNIINIGEDTQVSNIKTDDTSFFDGEVSDIAVEKASKIDDTGYYTILSSDETPLIVSKTIDSKRVIITSFDLHESDFVLYKEFPIFIQNCFDIFAGAGNIENPDISESNLRSRNAANDGSKIISTTNINRSIQAMFAFMFVLLVIADVFASGKGVK